MTRPRAASLPAAVPYLLAPLLAAGCGESEVVVVEPSEASPAPLARPAPRPTPAPRVSRSIERRGTPDAAPPAPLAVRDEPDEREPAPPEPEPEPAAEAPPEPEVVRDDAYFKKLWAELPAPVAPLPPLLEPRPSGTFFG